ncbi:transglycosylase SLT domain-containing protein [Aliikangiella sp. IMCC44359]|uniref:transglycosylase SLT domain-containing protein n=1 Tax=Aliikangiella sp. IMCC44359 TaxID=3459125 RepID=UPI00403B1316
MSARFINNNYYLLVLLCCVFFSNSVLAKINQTSPEQQLFLDAELAISKKDWSKYNKLESKLKNYPLLSYLQRNKLLANINLNHTQQIESFLSQYGDEPVSRKLRYKWLHWLAKNNHSSLFLRHYRDFGSTRLSCKQLEFRLKTSENENDIYAKVKQIWLTPRPLPKSCDKLISLWKKAGKMDDSLVWQRIILATENKNKKLAKRLINNSNHKTQDAGNLLLEVIKSPKKLAKTKFRKPLTNRAKDIIQIGLKKLAWEDPNLTIKIWQELGRNYHLKGQFTSLKRAISLSLAIEQDNKASSWLSSLTNINDSSVNQWMLSTALYEKNWSKIATLANQYANTKKDADKWHYWQAVAETQLGNLDKAKQLFESLAKKRQYYGFLAARQLNQPPELSHQAINFSVQELNEINQLSATIRAKEFYEMGRLGDARREWNYLVKKTPFENQTKLALIAHQWGWQHQAILAFARSKQINDIEKRFPLKYFKVYKEQAQQHAIPVSWAYAITRQESAFKADAISSAGARGLMQLKPSTARYVAKKMGKKRITPQLLKADTNIKLGTAHLSLMYNSFSSHPVLATAAYNAGKARVQQWLQNIHTQDPLEWIEQIPYKETREYVKNVLTYQLIYAKLTNQPDNFIAQLDNYPILPHPTHTASP